MKQSNLNYIINNLKINIQSQVEQLARKYYIIIPFIVEPNSRLIKNNGHQGKEWVIRLIAEQSENFRIMMVQKYIFIKIHKYIIIYFN